MYIAKCILHGRDILMISFVSDFQRTFHIAHVYDGCEGDRSYLQVSVEAPGNDWPSQYPPCSYDYHTVYPTILYAENINSGGELFDSSPGMF